MCSPNLQRFPSLWPHGRNTLAPKPAEILQELKSTQEERQCEEKKADSPLTPEVHVRSRRFKATRTQFGIRVIDFTCLGLKEAVPGDILKLATRAEHIFCFQHLVCLFISCN